MNYKKLEKKAKKLRQDTFLAFIEKGEAHLGGSFSIIETLISIFDVTIKKNDKFILSKSHASFPLCLILKQKGLNPKFTTHLEIDIDNGIFCTTGSLGHGLPIATGMAFARKIRNIKGRIFVMLSDGECQEGTTWESLLIASKHRLDNLTIVVDYNKIQALSTLEDALPLDNLVKKFRSFNCNCIDIRNGHSFRSIISALRKNNIKNKPKVIIVNTIKGRGVKEFENDPVWHARKLVGSEIETGKKRLGL